MAPKPIGDFTIAYERTSEGIPVLRFSGEICFAESATRWKSELAKALSAYEFFAIDLAGVTFFDSTALGVLLGTQKASVELWDSTPNKGFYVVSETLPGRIYMLMKLTGLNVTFRIGPC